MADIKQALDALKSVAKSFAPLATIGTEIDRLSALVAHEDELKAAIQDKLIEKANLAAEIGAQKTALEKAVNDAKTEHAKIEAGYHKRREELLTEYTVAQDERTKRLADLKNGIDEATANAAKQIDAITKAYAIERDKIVAERDAFVEDVKAQRAKIEANTAALQAKLDALRSEVAPLMKDEGK